MNKTIKAGVIGAAGYAGGELTRLLHHHPDTEIVLLHSRSQAGRAVHTVHEDLFYCDYIFEDSLQRLHDGGLDVLFLCLGHGESSRFMRENSFAPEIKIIDLANDFRLQENAVVMDNNGDKKQFIYGLPEVYFEAIKNTRYIANPGCFATCIQLGLLPLAQKGLPGNIYTTGITGATGAGQSLSKTSHFSWRANNIQAYKTLTHQHVPEVVQTLSQSGQRDNISVDFIPWRGDFPRGIFVSSTVKVTLPADEVQSLYRHFYKDAVFTKVSNSNIALKQVVNTNYALIQLVQSGDTLVIHSAIDNLLKGASGQAVQNMNIMFGLPEETGLQLKSIAF